MPAGAAGRRLLRTLMGAAWAVTLLGLAAMAGVVRSSWLWTPEE